MSDFVDDIPVVIFAGGVGSRLGEHTSTIPKPMVNVGGVPILYRIMASYRSHGFRRFVVLGGYLFEALKSRMLMDSYGVESLEIDFASGRIEASNLGNQPDWKVTLLNTGIESETERRLAMAKEVLQPYSRFFLTYGDGLSDIDFREQLKAHESSGKLATVTAVRSPSKYGHLEIGKTGQVMSFVEKPAKSEDQINGGFFVMDAEVLALVSEGENIPLERGLLPKLAGKSQLNAYLHEGFWKCMDTPKDKVEFDELAKRGQLPGSLS